MTAHLSFYDMYTALLLLKLHVPLFSQHQQLPHSFINHPEKNKVPIVNH